MSCQLCKRLCSSTDHLHGLKKDELHLCEWENWFGSAVYISHDDRRFKHSCSALCAAQGTCEIETAPQLIESTFTGLHESFQYTKVRTFELWVPSLWSNNPTVFARFDLSEVQGTFSYRLPSCQTASMCHSNSRRKARAPRETLPFNRSQRIPFLRGPVCPPIVGFAHGLIGS